MGGTFNFDRLSKGERATRIYSRMNLAGTAFFVKKTPSYIRTASLGESVAAYWLRYFGNRSFPKTQEFYVVYTSADHSIPFQPDSALNYWTCYLGFLPTAMRLGGATSGEFFGEIKHAFVDIAREGCAAFKAVPTIMPRLSNHSGHALRAAQALLKPVNCSPSLHTAGPFYAYNLAARYFPEKEPELRLHVGNVVSTVIKTKLHAMVDVAFGIFLARTAITDRLGLNFNDLEFFFTQVQQSKDRIPYEHVYGMYHEINELEKASAGEARTLPKLMERYFQEIGLPRVRREQSNCLYDLEQKVLVYPSELIVGSGLL